MLEVKESLCENETASYINRDSWARCLFRSMWPSSFLWYEFPHVRFGMGAEVAEGKGCSAKCEGDVYRLIGQGNYWPGTEPKANSKSFGAALCL